MPFGPILGRELLTMPRKSRGHGTRVTVALTMAGALAANYYGFREYYENGGHFTLSQLSEYARSTFFSMAAMQLMMTLIIVPGLVSTSIAEEKERKTIHYLLASQLGSGEIVLGKLAARMLQYLVAITAGLPIFLILTLLGGFQPEWVFALYLMTLAMAFFLGGMSIFASVISKRTKQASNLAALFAVTWFIAPIVLWIFRLARLIPNAFRPTIDFLQTWLFDVSPTSFMTSFSVILGRGNAASWYEQALRMIALQLAYGSILILLAIVLLRPAYRRQDNPSRRLIDRLRGVRTVARKHPAIGEWPILWKECFTAPPVGVGRFLRYIIAIFFLTSLCIGMFRLAQPILATMMGFLPDNPQWIDRRRDEVNSAVRILTAVIYGFSAMLIVGSGALMISTERERDTWEGLIVTPMEPRQIILQKMLGAIYQQRWMLLPLLIVWTTGLTTGGVSYLAVLIVLCEFVVFLGFASAVGVWSSLHARGTSKASSWAGALILLPNSVGLLIAWALNSDSIVFATLCSPVTVSLSLFRLGTERSGFAHTFNDYARGFYLTPLICLLGVLFYAGAGLMITWDSIRRFDRAVGRPHRKAAPVDGEEPANRNSGDESQFNRVGDFSTEPIQT